MNIHDCSVLATESLSWSMDCICPASLPSVASTVIVDKSIGDSKAFVKKCTVSQKSHAIDFVTFRFF